MAKQDIWWIPIHLLFVPSLTLMIALQIPSWIFLLSFIGLLLIYWGTFTGDVPLFLSSPEVANEVAVLLSREKSDTCLELGAGTGTIAVALAKLLPQVRIKAVERAPLPWLVALIRSRKFVNLRMCYQDLFKMNLDQHKFAFAFLSPVVMEKIGEKIRAEMPQGSLFVSSSFIIPEWEEEQVITVNDKRKTRLYCYRIK
ncbi:MAG: hypothetical protein PHC51_06340 [bacterium]|nr:hypothetical protein [bacterium]